MNSQTFKKFIKDYYPFILFFVLMLLMHLIMGVNGDDIKYSKVLSNQTVAGYINYRYHNWSSRLVIESILIVLARQSIILWGILDSVIYAVAVYYTVKLFNYKNSKHIAFLGVLLFLMYPFHEMASAGWMATTLNYLWCFAFGMIASIPLINWAYDEKTSIPVYIISFLALIYAVNQEQCCALIFGFNILILLNCLITKKKLNRYNILVILVSFASMIFILTCPGNSIRFAAETSYWYPQFASYGILENIYLGIIPTFSLLLEEKIIFPLFYLILTLAALTKVKNKYLKYALYLNAVFILFLVGYKTLLDISTLGTALNSNTLTQLTSPFAGVVNIIPPLKQALVVMRYETIAEMNVLTIAIALYLLISCCLLLVKVFGNIRPLVMFLAGFASKFITAFSPTVFVSGPRTMIFFYFILIMLILMLIVKLFDENKINAKWDKWMTRSFIVLAGINYLFVFAIVFVKYSLFV